jgi:hypothetical protein
MAVKARKLLSICLMAITPVKYLWHTDDDYTGTLRISPLFMILPRIVNTPRRNACCFTAGQKAFRALSRGIEKARSAFTLSRSRRTRRFCQKMSGGSVAGAKLYL